MAAVVFGLTLLLIRILFSVMGAYARREHLRDSNADDADLQDARKKFRVSVIAYVVTILLGLLAPTVAIALYFAIAVFLVVPFRTVPWKLLGRRSE
jgi:TMEM175 potassium channel family protein